MDIRITDTLESVGRWAGLVARYTSDNNNYYMRESGTTELKKVQGGVVSVLDTASLTSSHTTVYDVKFEVIGTTISRLHQRATRPRSALCRRDGHRWPRRREDVQGRGRSGRGARHHILPAFLRASGNTH
jgi:hypothetical protein